jgi:hypothetical protein
MLCLHIDDSDLLCSQCRHDGIDDDDNYDCMLTIFAGHNRMMSCAADPLSALHYRTIVYAAVHYPIYGACSL